MISQVNNFLKPLENFLIKNKKIIWYFILFFLLFAIYFIQNYKLSLLSAEIAMILLWIILWIPIFSRVFGLKIFTAILAFRKELGIVMGIFSLVHLYFMFGMLKFYFTSNPVLFAVGILPQIIIFLLTITSNEFSKDFLWKYWKKLHRLVYLALPMILIQISLGTEQIKLKNGFAITDKFEIFPWILLILYFVFKILEFKNIRLYKQEIVNYPKWQKFLCVPCGYIYDPVLGDEEDGIAPGTEFVDIPDSWRCPDCGVTKADFVPYNDGDEIATEPLKIIEKIWLNSTTIELILSAPKEKISKIGQFATFEYMDEEWKFRRQYSVSKAENGKIHFLIKVKSVGRGAKILQKINAGENMNFVGFFGDFVLQDTENPKIFIATGTGLAPIYRMMTAAPNIAKKLYFSVSTADETFYKKELDSIENLENISYVSRECVQWYCEGRMKLEDIFIDTEAEYYLCGNPKMVEDTVAYLQKSGCKNVYFEQFA